MFGWLLATITETAFILVDQSNFLQMLLRLLQICDVKSTSISLDYLIPKDACKRSLLWVSFFCSSYIKVCILIPLKGYRPMQAEVYPNFVSLSGVSLSILPECPGIPSTDTLCYFIFSASLGSSIRFRRGNPMPWFLPSYPIGWLSRYFSTVDPADIKDIFQWYELPLGILGENSPAARYLPKSRFKDTCTSFRVGLGPVRVPFYGVLFETIHGGFIAPLPLST